MKKAFKAVLNLLALLLLTLVLSASVAVYLDPVRWTFAPILAYGLPYVILFSIICTVVLFFLNAKTMALLNLVALLFACYTGKPYLSFGNTTEPSSKASIKVMSYNVRHFDRLGNFEIPRENIRDSILGILAEENADIYCFQECYYDTKPNKFIYQSDIINATKAPFEASSKTVARITNRHLGCFIFSKKPIISSGKVSFENPEYHKGICHFADIQWDDSLRIRVYNFHLASLKYNQSEYAFVEDLENGAEINEQKKQQGKQIVAMFLDAAKRRSPEVKTLVEHASKSPYPVILCGDLNDTPTSFAYRQLYKNFSDAFSNSGWGFGKTYSGKMPSNRIDYIFFDSSFEANFCQVLPNVLSDHKAIVAELGIR